MKYLQQKFDWFIYHRAYKSLERLSESSIGFVYLLELWLGYWREKYGIPDSLKRSTESFFRTQRYAIRLKEEIDFSNRIIKQYAKKK